MRGVALSVLWSLAALAGPERPRLGVVIVVDQLSGHHFDRRVPSATGGFKRLVDEGFRFLDARYEAAPPITSAGHATLSTGAYPDVNGIVANVWIDPATHQKTYSVEDARYPTLSGGKGVGPAHLKAGTLADALKASVPESRVVSLAGKDRSAILLGGQGADVALWIDRDGPRFTTSTLYGHALPEWVAPINDRLNKAIAQGLTWPAPKGVPAESPGRGFQRDVAGFGSTWPHQVKKDAPPREQVEALMHHPIVNSLLVDLAIASLQGEKLGQRGASDLLLVSFSSFDFVVHAFGPDSAEADAQFQDIDQQLGRLFAALDQRVGRGRYTVVLTADHGGASVPEMARLRGVDAGRLDEQKLTALLERTARDALGARDWFLGFEGMGVYAAPGTLLDLHGIEPKLREAARSVPGVLDLVPRDEILAGVWGEQGLLLRRGIDRERSPDWVVLLAPYWLYGTEDAAAHGSIHVYDRQIPMVWMGAGIRHGEGGRAESVDVAPTLAFLLDSEAPSDAEGRLLTEALTRLGR